MTIEGFQSLEHIGKRSPEGGGRGEQAWKKIVSLKEGFVL